MSGHTPVAMSWSTARMTSTVTPWRRMISIEMSARPCGVGHLGRPLQRAVDEQRPEVGEVPPALLAQFFLHGVERRHGCGDLASVQAGLTFWLPRKTLSGPHCPLTAARRRWFRSPDAALALVADEVEVHPAGSELGDAAAERPGPPDVLLQVGPACTSTSTPRSSSTTRRTGRCAPRPPPTTAATSRSASGLSTCPRCGKVGFPANRRLLDVERSRSRPRCRRLRRPHPPGRRRHPTWRAPTLFVSSTDSLGEQNPTRLSVRARR